MRYINKVLLPVLVLLGASTGLVKIFQLEDEMILFRGAGWSDAAIIMFGVFQLLAALAIIPKTTRKLASMLLGFSFVIATGVLFVEDKTTFGVFSISFIALAFYIAFSNSNPEQKKNN